MTEALRSQIVILALAVGLSGCASNPGTSVSSDDLLAAIEAGHAPTILDVRSRWEYDAGHLPGAIHFPFYAAWTHDAEILAAKDDEVVLYCEHGPRAGLARFGLTSSGFERVRSLSGHMAGWRSGGLPIVTESQGKPRE